MALSNHIFFSFSAPSNHIFFFWRAEKLKKYNLEGAEKLAFIDNFACRPQKKDPTKNLCQGSPCQQAPERGSSFAKIRRVESLHEA